MSEIISSPLIFTQQEVKDRFQLHQFIHKLFTPCKADKGDLTGLPADELYHIFKIQYPMNTLNVAIVSNMLLTGGFIDEENPEMSILYAKLDSIYFMALKKEAKICLLPYIKAPLDIKYRQLVLGIKVLNNDTGEVTTKAEYALNTFLTMCTLNKNNASNYMRSFTPAHRSTTLEVYNYYIIMCGIYGLPTVEKPLFIPLLEDLGFLACKGRVHEKAGVRYFRNLYIPMSIEDKILSVELNMCCISNGTTHWTKEGILENMIEAQRAELCNNNLERIGIDEQKRASFEEEKAKLDLRRTFETGEVPLGHSAKAHEAQNNMGHNDGPESESQEAEIEIIQPESEDIQRTSGFKETTDSDAAPEVRLENVVDLSQPLDIGETYRDRYAQFCNALGSEDDDEVGSESDDEEFGTDAVDSDGPSIEEIAVALMVPYRMTQGEFTYEVMCDWLQKMGIPNVLDEHPETYNDIMEILLNC